MRACYEMRLFMAYKNTSATRVIRYGILLLLLLIMGLGPLLSGCAGRRVAVSGSEYLSPEAALRALASSDPGDRTLTVTARIEIKRLSERHVMKAALMMKRPAHLRLESIPLFGPPDFFLSIEAGEIRVFIPGKETFYVDRATEGNLSRFFPLALPAAETVSLLMGRLPETRGDGFFLVAGNGKMACTGSTSTDPEGKSSLSGSIRQGISSAGFGHSQREGISHTPPNLRSISDRERVSCRSG